MSDEILRLRRVCHVLGEALAKRCLDDANRERETERTWPAGQAWPDLAASSQSMFRHRAWEEAGLTKEEMRALLFDKYGNPKEYEGCE